MKVLLVGSGGREHAMAWKIAQSPLVDQLLIAPGNAGTADTGENVAIGAEDIPGLLRLAQERDVDLTIVGPEAPLVGGIVDAFSAAGLRAFGPTAAAARIEGSKAWANDLMARYGIPTGDAHTFTVEAEAIEFLRSRPEGSLVVKADGLAAGKGVIIADTYDDAELAIRLMQSASAFGAAGRTVVLEERLSGPEVSVFAFVSGEYVSPEVAACDYKRVGDGDTGPNTGGMGSYSPPEFWTPELAARVRSEILERTARAMVREGCPFTGILYAGLMLTDDGPKVIEFNCRMGDPECEVVMPLLTSDLVAICNAATHGQLDQADVRWAEKACVGVVMVSGGYPGNYDTGKAISGLNDLPDRTIVFHAGTAKGGDGQALTAGGRVLVTVGTGESIDDARVLAYRAAESISFDGAYYRRDIALRATGARL